MFLHLFVFALVHARILGEKCICVPLFKCKTEDLESYDESSSYDDLNLWGFPCESDMDVCCRLKCGQRQTETLPFNDLRGGNNEANFAEFPWMLAILYENTYRCGGSLIHPQVALTAAHCVNTKGRYTVRAGEWDRSRRNEPLKHQDRQPQKIIIHEEYNPRTLTNDIALVILKRPFQLSENVGIACLPQNSAPIPPECIVTGWGQTSYKSKNQKVLQKATFPIVPRRKCEMALQKALLGPFFSLHLSFICAGSAGKDTCKGDGGSPLMCGVYGEENIYEQFGIVSWGLTCGNTGTPGVYTSVTKFVGWIDRQVVLHGFTSDVYKHKK